jgi:hypothetical protein
MIAPMSPSGAPDPAISVFCSYSRHDEPLRQELDKHLMALERAGMISLWHDRKIPTGAEWQPELDARLEQAQIILLFVTSNFVASDFCWKIELERAMQRHRSGQARVIPILLEPVFWRLAPFAALQVLPKDGVPVTSWANRDQAYAEIVRSIQEVAEALASKRRGDPASAGSDRRLALELWTARAAAQNAGSRDIPAGPAAASAQYRIGD